MKIISKNAIVDVVFATTTFILIHMYVGTWLKTDGSVFDLIAGTFLLLAIMFILYVIIREPNSKNNEKKDKYEESNI